MKDSQRIDAFDILFEIIIIAMIMGSPLALGSVAPWARSVVSILALALVSIWLMQGARLGRLRVVRNPVWVFAGLFFALAVVQIIPFSPSMLKGVSPGAWRMYASTLMEYPASGDARTISVNPYGTVMEMIRLAALLLVFFVVTNALRFRWQAVGIIIALLAVGSFQAMYGFAEYFSGHKYIFWIPREYHLSSVTGTFHNKNHFSGLLEMIVPVFIGFLLSLGFSKKPPEKDLSAEPAWKRLILNMGSNAVGQQIIIAALSIIMVVGIFFSLSRAGIICILASLMGFSLFLAPGKGSRRYVLVIMAILVAVFIVGASIGMELVIDSLEDALGGRATSWYDRLDLARSALDLIGEYPLLGTGLGTFGVAFPAYQSSRFGDTWADFLHNDWLQAFCEMGVIGGSLVVAAMLLLFAGLLRAALKQENVFNRWIAIGGLLGCAAMLLHSFFDYNLSKITSNGIAFASILGVAYVAANTQGGQKDFGAGLKSWTMSLGSIYARALPVLFAIGLMALGFPFLADLARADINLNHYKVIAEPAGKADNYFFLPVEKAGSRGDEKSSGASSAPDEAIFSTATTLIQKTIELDPNNPRYIYYCAYDALRAADRLVRQRASQRAAILLDSNFENERSEEFERIVAALSVDMKREMYAEREPFLVEAKSFLYRAIGAAPSVARYHTVLASVLAEIDPLSEEVAARAHIGLSCYPNMPDVLFDAGSVLLVQSLAEKDLEKRERTLETVREHFRKAILIDPSYSERVYPLAEAVMGGGDSLLAVTPETLPALERLYLAMWKAGKWEAALACLDKLDKMLISPHAIPDQSRLLVEKSVPHPNPAEYSAEIDLTDIEMDSKSQQKVMLSVARRRCTALAMLGIWNERVEAVSRYRELFRIDMAADMEKAAHFRELGRYGEALRMYVELLQFDWANSDVLLSSAELALTPGALDGIPHFNTALDQLYRLVINNEELTPAAYERAKGILNDISPDNPSDQLVVEFVLGVGAILAGQAEDGLAMLQELASRTDEAANFWRQKHLIWFYIGRAHEDLGQTEEAREAYNRVLDIVPTHRPSLQRLLELGAAGSEAALIRLAVITPQSPCHVDFGGKVTLLGYTLNQSVIPVKMRGVTVDRQVWIMILYWQFNDRTYKDYRPSVHFCRDDWRAVFTGDHRIRDAKGIYPMDFPRCGEVVVDTLRLKQDPSEAPYLRLGMWTANPPEYLPDTMNHDAGGGFFRTVLFPYL